MGEIKFENVSREFGSTIALSGINLTIADNEFMAVVGPSGCGKTTLMRMVAGLEFPSSGDVKVSNHSVSAPGPDRAVVFQQFALFPWKTVAENIGFGLECKHVAGAERKRIVESYIHMMHLEGHEKSFPHQLSGGMQQRVALARSYAVQPSVLLMDEPFGALDAQTRTVMQEELVKICRSNPRTVLFITHAVEEAVYLADRVAVMSRRPGRIHAIIDIASIRKSENWDGYEHIEDVLDLPSFNALRTQIWRLIRGQKEAA